MPTTWEQQYWLMLLLEQYTVYVNTYPPSCQYLHYKEGEIVPFCAKLRAYPFKGIVLRDFLAYFMILSHYSHIYTPYSFLKLRFRSENLNI
jgi:hypothetical protein